jgi:hypothetical protein
MVIRKLSVIAGAIKKWVTGTITNIPKPKYNGKILLKLRIALIA